MRRQDDRYGTTRLYVGRLSSRTRSRDLEDLFSRYGRVRDVDMKHDFAFVDFSDPRDADDARYNLNGRDFDGSRILVEFARGAPRSGGGGDRDRGGDYGGRGGGGSRDFLGRGPPPGSGRCFNCGIDGHWARDCKSGDWKNKCYRCGDRGHIERNCQNSPKSLSGRGKSYSRSPSPRRGRARSYSRSRSDSRSRSPPRRGRRSTERERSRSPRYSNSPKSRKSPPPSKGRKHSLSPDDSKSPPPPKARKHSPSPDGSKSPPPSKARKHSPSPDGSKSPQERPSLSPKGRVQPDRNGSDYSGSPRRDISRSPRTNGRSVSPMDDNNASPKGTVSPQD